MWLSERDTVEVFRCAVAAPVAFGIYYAVSDNPNRRWDMTDTMLELGYRPRDSWHASAHEEEKVVPGGEHVSPEWPTSEEYGVSLVSPRPVRSADTTD